MIYKKTSLKNLEKNRYSIIAGNLERCYVCGGQKQHLHEVIFGKNRQNSMKYGLVIPVCMNCHNKIHNNIELDTELKKIAQEKFIEHYPELDFLEIFKRNYL